MSAEPRVWINKICKIRHLQQINECKLIPPKKPVKNIQVVTGNKNVNNNNLPHVDLRSLTFICLEIMYSTVIFEYDFMVFPNKIPIWGWKYETPPKSTEC